MTDRQAYRIGEFAAAYGLSRRTVYRQIEQGKLTARKTNGAVLILRHDADAWAEALPVVPAGGSGDRNANARDK